MNAKRINTLEFREATYLTDTPPKMKSFHIDRWQPNNYYGKESEYIKGENDFYINPKNRCHKIHKSCFKYPEYCYAIAEFEYNSHENCYEFKWIGNRPLDLTTEEEKDFKELIIYGFEILNGRNQESETDN